MSRIRYTIEALLELLRIDDPVSQGGIVIIAMTEPAVIEDQQLDAKIRRTVSQLIDLLIIKVKIGSLPVIDKNWAQRVLMASAHDMFAHDMMEGLAHAIESIRTERHQCLRGLETLPRLQMPAELSRIDATEYTGRSELLNLRPEGELSAPDQAEPINIPARLRSFFTCQSQERRLLMGACATAAGCFLDAMHERHPLQAALRCMPAIETQPVKIMVGKIHGKAGGR